MGSRCHLLPTVLFVLGLSCGALVCPAGPPPASIDQLLAAGFDPLRVMADFAHRHGREIFWSLRMNDTHDGSKTDYGPIMLRANALKMAHPEWMIGSANDKPTYGDWLADGLVDLLVASGYFQLAPWSDTVALGHAHGVKVYASLDESRVRDEKARALRSSLESYRGRAAAAWAAGVDGISLFNAFNPRHPLWRELGSADDLAGLDKDYFASVRGVGAAAGGALPHAAFVRVPTLNPASPIRIPAAGKGTTWFDAGRESATPARVAVLIQHSPGDMAVPPAVSFNGHALEAGIPEAEGWIRYAARQEWLQAGRAHA